MFLFLISVHGFTKADGLHYRQPWVIGVQEEIERLTSRLEEAEKVIKEVPILNEQIVSLEVSDHSLNCNGYCLLLFH